VYLLRCVDGTYYTGSTIDLQRRLAQHQSGRGARYTRSRLPVKLLWSSSCKNRSLAQQQEALIKSRSHTEKTRMISSNRKRL
jgi:putative endonuclease